MWQTEIRRSAPNRYRPAFAFLLIIRSGKPGAPVMITSVLPFKCPDNSPAAADTPVHPESRETLHKPPRSLTPPMRGRQAGASDGWPRRRKESERSLSPTHRLMPGLHAHPGNESQRRRVSEHASTDVVRPPRFPRREGRVKCD